jgi:hypothetical protein
MRLKTTLYYLNLAILFNLIIGSAYSFAGPSSTYLSLSEKNKNYWHKLLHIEENSSTSKFDGENFFLAKEGKNHPDLELQATIDAFSEPNKLVGWFQYPVQCVFRERFNFLKEIGLLIGVPETSCPMFEEWKNGLNVNSLTIVFSSSYPNNPSSLFGHTLIRLNQKNKTNDLLDYAVSFSAIPNANDIGIVFAFKGMFGGYRGLVEISKYYTKVNEYSNSESRDLIEYDLNLTPQQVDRFINHVWEIYQTTYADYFFHNENCSSVLADILAVSLDEREGFNKHSRWYFLPVELIKKINNIPELVIKKTLRPSLKKQLEKQLSKLNDQEIFRIKESINSKEIPNDLDKVEMLDGLISYLDYTRYRTKGDFSEEDKALFRKCLIKRSKIKIDSKLYTDYESKNFPEIGHDSKNISTFLSFENNHSQLGFEFKNGYHYLMGRDLGFDPFSQFDFLTGSFLYDKQYNKLNYDHFTIVHLTSLHPYHFYDPQLSWNASVNLNRYYQKDGCELCHQLDLRASGGFTTSVDGPDRLSLFGGFFSEISSHLQKGGRAGPILEVSYLVQLKESVKIGLFSEERFSAIQNFKKDFQNISTIKMNYFPERNKEYKIELKQVSQFGSWNINTRILSLGYGKYF